MKTVSVHPNTRGGVMQKKENDVGSKNEIGVTIVYVEVETWAGGQPKKKP